MTLSTDPERRLVLCVDIESYSARDDGGQHHLQSSFPDIMNEAAARCGLGRDAWTIQSTGDGELAIFPSGTSEPKVVAELVPALDRALRARNTYAADRAKIRLRAALHQGNIRKSPMGYAGQAIVKVCRLVDADDLRQALVNFPSASVALIVSKEMFEDVVSQSYPGIRPERYRKTTVNVKSFKGEAWIFVPDEDANGGPKPARVPPPDPEPSDGTGSIDDARSNTSRSATYKIRRNRNKGNQIFGDHGQIHGSTA